MNGSDWLVLIGALVLGYVLVSMFWRKEPRVPTPADRPSFAQPPADAATPDAPTPWHVTLALPADAPLESVHAAYLALREQYSARNVEQLGPEFVALAERKSAIIEAAYRDALAAHSDKT